MKRKSLPGVSSLSTDSSKSKEIFREESVQQSLSPGKIGQLFLVAERRDWLPLGFLGISLFAAIVWSFLGRIPVKVTSKGILSNPQQVIDLESPVSGQVTEFYVAVGDQIEKNQLIATIYSSEIAQRLKLERLKLSQLKQQAKTVNEIQDRRTELELETISQQILATKQQLEVSQEISLTIRGKGEKALKQRRISLNQEFQDAKAIDPILKNRVEKRRSLAGDGVISEDQILDSIREYKENLQGIATLEADLRDLDIREAEVKQEYLEAVRSASELNANLGDFETQKKRLQQENLEAVTVKDNEIEDVKRRIAELEKEYSNNKEIKSPHSGQILELTAKSGSVLSPGVRLGTLETNGNQKQVTNIAYFPVSDGKKIEPGMKIQITPDTVRRERFGGIIGAVTSISNFPVTQEGIIDTVGNINFVTVLSSQEEPMIEIKGTLETSSTTPSGYNWSSSQGPRNIVISSGTTTSTTITVEERAPITFVLPALRELSGVF